MAFLPLHRSPASPVPKRDIACARRSRGCSPILILAAAVCGVPAASAAVDCADWHVVFLSLDGTVEIQRAGTSSWDQADSKDLLCSGDSLRVQSYGEATIELPDRSKISLKHNTSVTFEAEEEVGWLLKLLRGALHVISRDPRALKFSTPYVNAGLEGTEFVIGADDAQSEIAVLEGEVIVTNPNGRIAAVGGQLASARGALSPVTTAVPAPIEYSRWAAYYPAILDFELPDPEAAPTPAEAREPAFFTARAARRLKLGRVDTAKEDLDRAVALAPDDSTAAALSAVIALTQGDQNTAGVNARRAVDAAPDSVPALLALSYVEQAGGELAGAARTLQRAIELAPSNPIAWSRVAEVELANRDLAASVAAATTAIQINSNLAQPHAALGFAGLSRSDIGTATEAFRRAIELDQAWPLPHVGLALALIQEGNVAAGREELEIAVIHDPSNAVVRSYMAKTYELERRTELTETQLQLAKDFDSADPTAHYYDSFSKYNTNRPVEALYDLQAAAELGDQRLVHRSTLWVDEDLAARAAAPGLVYRDLGFEQLALLNGTKALAADSTDHSALLLLGNIYSALPRHEMSRANALYQSQMLQPLNLTPVGPRLAEANLFIADEAGPGELALGQFSPLLSSNGLKFRGSAVGGTNGTLGEELVLAGLHDRLSYTFGHSDFETEGFRANNDLDQRVTNALVQYRPTYGTSLQAELRSTEIESGDLLMRFDQANFNPRVRQGEQVDSVRLGVRHELSARSTLLASIIYQDLWSELDNSPAFYFAADGRGTTTDVRHIVSGARWSVDSGFMYFRQERIDQFRLAVPIPFPPFALDETVTTDADQTQRSVYSYAQLHVTDDLSLTIGASADDVDGPALAEETISPKFGLTWEITDRTMLRAAAFGTLQGPWTSSKQNIQPRLEPFQVAGFNQFFADREGDEARFGGVALDHQISTNLATGLELSERELTARFFSQQPTTSDPIRSTEQISRGYVYWTPLMSLSLSAEFRHERVDNDGEALVGVVDVRTRRLPIEGRYYHPSGFNMGLRAELVEQQGEFSDDPLGIVSTTDYRADEFWVLDASLGYRLPNRRGVVTLNVDNLFDQSFNFQDLDPLNPSIAPERMAYLRFTLAFE
jgi:tetratricopeptide (TPR) repeat protein